MVLFLEVHPSKLEHPETAMPLAGPLPSLPPSSHVPWVATHRTSPGPLVPSSAIESPPGASEAPARTSVRNPKTASTHALKAQRHAPAKPGNQRSLDYDSNPKLNAHAHWLALDLSAEADVDLVTSPTKARALQCSLAGWTRIHRKARHRPQRHHYWADISWLIGCRKGG